MRPSKIMFSNLRAEMARENLSITYMAEKIGMKRDTLGKKLSGKSPINLDEAFKINKEFFPDKNIPFLFEELLENIEQN